MFVVEGHGEKSGVRSCDHAFILISGISLIVSSEITPDRLGFHSTIAAEEYAYYGEKAPRLSEDRRSQRLRRSVWLVWSISLSSLFGLSGAMNKRDETDKIDQTDTHKCQPARRAHAALEAAFSKSS